MCISKLRGGHARIVRGRRKFQRAHAWSPDLDQHTDGKLRRRRILLSRPNFDLGPWIRVKSARIRALRAELRSTAYYSCVPSIHACSKKDKAVYTDTILRRGPRVSYTRTTSPHTEISCEISGCSCVVFACTKFCVLQAVLERSKHPASCVVLTDLEFLPMELVVVASTSSST